MIMNEVNDNQVVLFGQINYRNKTDLFGIKMDDRRRHMYVIGKTGMGKSELLKNIAIQDVLDGRGLCFLDPHGDIIDDLLSYIPEHRIKDVIYINPADLEHPVAFNVMEQVDFDKRQIVTDGMMAVFKKIWVDAWSARMEYILNYTILALLEAKDSTLLGINRMLADKDYRKNIVSQVSDPEVRAFWTQEFAKYDPKYAAEATAAIQNKIGQFVSNTLIRNIVGQPKSSFNMRQAMDEQKIILVDISKGRIGEDSSRLLGALLITRVQLGAMSRVDIPRHERKDFVLMVDEFQNFATASFANILSEARKFNLSLVVAHQYVAQMEEEVADAVFGNVGTIISFRVGAEDAEMLEKEFSPEFLATDIVNLGKRQIYLKLMIDGVASRAFSAMTMETLKMPEVSLREQVIANSRKTYSNPRAEVEKSISDWRLTAPTLPPGVEPAVFAERPPKPAYKPSYGSPREDRSPRRDDRPFRRDEQRSGPPRQDRGTRPERRPEPRRDLPAQAGRPAPTQELSLNALTQPPPERRRDDRPEKPKTPSPATAEKASANRDELRKLLRESLGKKEEPREV